MTNTPFDQGAQAFLNDAPTASCTFALGSTMQREWVDGWSQRQDRERMHRSRAIGKMNMPAEPTPTELANASDGRE